MKRIGLKRIAAFVIDWICVFAIGCVLFFSGLRFDVEYLINPSIEMFSAGGVIFGILSFILLPLLKDCLFNHASFGKWLMKLKIVDKNTHSKTNIGKLILRNITFYFPFIELALLLLNKGETLGDMITHTTVIEKTKETS